MHVSADDGTGVAGVSEGVPPMTGGEFSMLTSASSTPVRASGSVTVPTQ